jgi:SAM-dependent methyltransferase
MAELRTPEDIATRHTVTLLRAHLPPAAKLLEIGCGTGQVAQALLDEGYQVLAIDPDANAVSQARTLGVPAFRAAWPDFRGGPFDAIAFTRSLHHIGPLRAAVRRARELLQPQGVMLVEDFAYTQIDDRTLAWFLATVRTASAQDLLRPVPGELVTRLLAQPNDPRAAWQGEHDHKLHAWSHMSTAIAECFEVRDQRATPYLFRYLIPVVGGSAAATAFVLRIRQQEMDLAERNEIALIGRRLVAVPKAPDPHTSG